MKKILTSTLLSLLFTSLWAYDISVDGICYNLHGKNAYVTYNSSSKYTGSVNIPSSITFHDKEFQVTRIEKNAFSSCSGLTSVTIPNTVEYIGESAFQRCTGLTEITLPKSVIEVGNSCFASCTNLATVNATASLVSVGSNVFDSTKWLTGQADGPIYVGSVLYAYKGKLPASFAIQNGTMGIAAYAFCQGASSNRSSFTSVSIPSTVISIGERAFAGCTKLSTIDIPSSVTQIGEFAFLQTAWYNSQSDGMVYAGNVAYGYKGTMPDNTSIVIKDGTTAVADAGLTISSSGLYESKGLTEVSLPNSVKYLGKNAFRGCSNLKQVSLPNSIKSIGENTFNNCTSLESVTFPNQVTVIGNMAFYKCAALKAVIIPNSVTEIGDGAFEDCSAMSEITLSSSLGRLGSDALSGTKITSLVVPNSVTAMNSVFNEAPIASIVIGESVVAVTGYCFKKCYNLKEIHCVPTVPPLCDTDICHDATSVYSNCTLYVPKGTKDVYAATDGWSKFLNIQEEDNTGIETISANNAQASRVYDANGRVTNNVKAGVNIIKYSDGSYKKLILK